MTTKCSVWKSWLSAAWHGLFCSTTAIWAKLLVCHKIAYGSTKILRDTEFAWTIHPIFILNFPVDHCFWVHRWGHITLLASSPKAIMLKTWESLHIFQTKHPEISEEPKPVKRISKCSPCPPTLLGASNLKFANYCKMCNIFLTYKICLNNQWTKPTRLKPTWDPNYCSYCLQAVQASRNHATGRCP